MNRAIKAWSFAEAGRSEDDVEFGLGVTLANPAYDEDIPLLKQIKVPVAEQDDDRDHVDELGQRNPGTGLRGLAEAPLAGADGVVALGPVDSHILRGVGRGQDSLGGLDHGIQLAGPGQRGLADVDHQAGLGRLRVECWRRGEASCEQPCRLPPISARAHPTKEA